MQTGGYAVELYVDPKKKAEVQNAIARNKKSVRIIVGITKILLLVGIVGGGIYALANIFIPSLSIVNVNGVPHKDSTWIIVSTSFIVAPCLILSLCLKVLAGNLAGVDNSARVDESLLISDESIRYSFRLKYHSLSSERRVVTIPFSRITGISRDPETEALEFDGNFVSEYFDDYTEPAPVDIAPLTQFVIYDYFSPSLKETLLTKGISVNN